MAPVFSRSAWLCAWHLIQDGGGRGKSSGQSKYSGGAFNITDFLHAFCGTSLLHGLKMEVHIILSIFAAVAPPVVFRRKSLTGILPAVDPIGKNVLAGVFYFIGFGLFCLESMLSIWVIQQVYMYFRGGGKAAQMKQEAARGALTAAI